MTWMSPSLKPTTTANFVLTGLLSAGLVLAGWLAWHTEPQVSPETNVPSTPVSSLSRAERETARQSLYEVSVADFGAQSTIQLCQAYGPAVCNSPTDCGDGCNRRIDGVDCLMGNGCGETRWNQWGQIPWQALSQGEYIGPPRTPHVPEYRVRVDDLLEFRFVSTRTQSSHQYHLQVGDELKIESLIDPNINRNVTVQPDGSITLLLLGQVQAAKMTISELTALLKERYKEFYKIFDLTVSPVKTNTRLDDLMSAITNRFTAGGQNQQVRVVADGTISLTKIGKVPAQGLSLDELQAEVNARYAEYVDGLEVTAILNQRAPHFVYVLGEVRNSGRYAMDSPTTVMGALSLGGGWINGANLRQVVVFRRADDWRLIATKIDIRGAVYGKRPTPADEIYLRDSDVVVVPKSSVQQTDDLIELIFTRGVYRVLPIQFQNTRL